MLNLRSIRAPKSFWKNTAAYAFPEPLREAIARHGHVTLSLDRMPSLGVGLVRAEVGHPRGSHSVAKHLKGRLNIPGTKLALLHQVLGAQGIRDAVRLGEALKALPLTQGAPRPIDEAIGTAGSVAWSAPDQELMLHRRPGVFCAGEMPDWKARTGGDLLTACIATGRAAGQGVLRWSATTR